MKLKLIIILTMSLLHIGWAQVSMSNSSTANNQNATVEEEMPEFPGGEHALLKYLASLEIPIKLKGKEIFEKVKVGFIVDSSGYVINPEIIEGSMEELNQAALEHIKQMPRWKPGKQQGKPVRVFYEVPIRFYADAAYWRKRGKLEKQKQKKQII